MPGWVPQDPQFFGCNLTFESEFHSFDLACVYLEDCKGDGVTEIADADRQTLCFSAFSLRLDACLFCLCFSPLVPVLTDRSSSRGSHLEVNCDYEDLFHSDLTLVEQSNSSKKLLKL